MISYSTCYCMKYPLHHDTGSKETKLLSTWPRRFTRPFLYTTAQAQSGWLLEVSTLNTEAVFATPLGAFARPIPHLQRRWSQTAEQLEPPSLMARVFHFQHREVHADVHGLEELGGGLVAHLRAECPPPPSQQQLTCGCESRARRKESARKKNSSGYIQGGHPRPWSPGTHGRTKLPTGPPRAIIGINTGLVAKAKNKLRGRQQTIACSRHSLFQTLP